MILSQKILQLRKKQGWSQEELTGRRPPALLTGGGPMG